MREKPPGSDPFLEVDETSEGNILIAAKGSSILFFGQIFAYVMRFAFGIVVAQALGADGFGLYTLGVTTSILLATISRLGLSEGVVHFLPSAVKQQDESQILGILRASLMLPALISIILALLLFGMADIIALKVFNEPAAGSVLRWMSIAIPIIALGRILLASTRGFKYMRYGVIADNFAFNIVRLTLTVILLYIGWGLAGTLGAYVIAWAVTTALSIFYLNRIFSLKRSLGKAQLNIRKLLTFSAPICLTQIIRQLRGNFELLMLGMLSTMSSVGVYSAAIRVQAVGAMFLRAVEMVAKPIISELYHQGDISRLSQFYQTLSRWSFTFGLPYFITVLLFANPILAVFGEEFKAGSSVLIIVGIGTLVNAGTGMCGAMIVMTGHSKLSFFNSLVTLALGVTLNVILIPAWGLVGAAVATASSFTLINILRLFEVTLLLKLWPYNREIIKPIAATIIALVVGYFMNQIVPADNIIKLLFDMIVMWVSYISAIYLLGLTAEDHMLLRRTKRRFNMILNGRLSA
jgi:O-antigen/teichoic acid export membrane protein